ncbi:hypothetical protein [Streptomyces sp. NPDC026673]|uniref:hypothetical protein n=1 Tax=Streptomyces sp. NPDC026673 TaxID=3155724 RepID=UPI00340F588B
MRVTTDRLSTPVPADQWLVGLRFRATRTGETWHYFVIDDTAEAADAAAAAIRRAAARDRAAADPAPPITDLDVRRLRRSPLGQVYLEPGTRPPSPPRAR